MNGNRIGVAHSESVDVQSSQTTNTRWRTLCECFRRRKLMWIICLSIVVILILSGICIPIIIILTKKQNMPTTTPTETTSTTTPTITPTPMTSTTTTNITTSTTTGLFHNNMKWKQNGSTVAGGHGEGNQSNQLLNPEGIYVDDDDNQTLYIADSTNHRIVKWKSGTQNGEVLSGGNGPGNGMDQLKNPTDLIIDKKTNSLIICDGGNRRIVRQSLQDPTKREITISNISCCGLSMDNNGDLYVADYERDEVRRWSLGDKNGTLVADENRPGIKLNQLNYPTFIFVDEDHSVYVSYRSYHRVMKWEKGEEEGIIVAGGHGLGVSLTHVRYPMGVFVDHFGNLYVVAMDHHRVMRWLKGATEGSVVVGGLKEGNQPDQFRYPSDLSFDRKGNLYVSDTFNSRVQKFDIDVD